MKRYENQTFERFYDQDSALVFENMEFIRCRFYNSSVSITTNPRLRSTVRNVQIKDCVVAASAVDCAIIENVEVDGLHTGVSGKFLLQIFGAVFKHVTFRGKIGALMFSQLAGGPSMTDKQQHAFDLANAEYYRHVDWALDIRDAEFSTCDLRSVPARLVRRDPETQVVVTRAKLMNSNWRDLDLADTYWPQAFQLFLASNREDIVLVAPKQSHEFRPLLKGLHVLRNARIAEAD